VGGDTTREFRVLFGRFEYVLKRTGFLRPNRHVAQADWSAFARALGVEFFHEVAASGVANTLINEPPGQLLRVDLEWARPARALENTAELIERGVCRVRNSLFHGEKFVGDAGQDARDQLLIAEALNVLRAAEAKVPEVAEHLRE
jgi:hypothetical protein